MRLVLLYGKTFSVRSLQFWWVIVKLQPWKLSSSKVDFWPHIKKGLSIFFCTKLNTTAGSDEVLAIFESLPTEIQKELNESNINLAKIVVNKQTAKQKQRERNAELASLEQQQKQQQQ